MGTPGGGYGGGFALMVAKGSRWALFQRVFVDDEVWVEKRLCSSYGDLGRGRLRKRKTEGRNEEDEGLGLG
ncbi:uncharacterized protein G2W53_018530 [Senna tora]|uniref:Uncharacterized protein n=1 Tax=Senna tora TaxID=362788 RepID=A0A834TV73_9FABA|nr:uncharacterized protein G2W53_018530 [Senna tora]